MGHCFGAGSHMWSYPGVGEEQREEHVAAMPHSIFLLFQLLFPPSKSLSKAAEEEKSRRDGDTKQEFAFQK